MAYCTRHGNYSVFCRNCDLDTIAQSNMTYKLTEVFANRKEIVRAIWFAREQFPSCRPGQAFCNVYLKSRQTWPELYYEEISEKVIEKIQTHCAEHEIWVG